MTVNDYGGYSLDENPEYGENLIITYWGGDLNFATQRLLNKQKSLNQVASCITFTNTILFMRFNYFNSNHVYPVAGCGLTTQVCQHNLARF